LISPVSDVFQNLFRRPVERRDAATIERGIDEANRAFALLDAHLSAQPYVAGEHFTMGDIPAGAVAHRWLAIPGIRRPPLAALCAWHSRLAERAAFKTHVLLPLS